MDRLLIALGLGALLLLAPLRVEKAAEPAFFSLLFPQLMQEVRDEQGTQMEATPGEAVFL